jgi:poly-gamma-glutamate synthesis protein (capsule biosynthesis protein)
MIARAWLTRAAIQQVGFLPAYINRDAQPEIVSGADPRFDQIVQYMRRVSEGQRLRVHYEPEGDVVWIREPGH